jgi:AcrR family transcriptional regulator
VGLNTSDVVAAAAALADEAGIGAVSLTSLAERLGVKPPALYKHVENLADLQHRIAALAMGELAEVFRDAVAGKAGPDALAALFTAMRGYVEGHPGRYSATVGAEFRGQDDPLLVAGVRVINSIAAVLAGYGIRPDETDHAIRAMRCVIHGFASLQAANAFQWGNDPDESFAWMIRFVDAGLHGMGKLS